MPFAGCVGSCQSCWHGEPDVLNLFCPGMGHPCQAAGVGMSSTSSMLVDTGIPGLLELTGTSAFLLSLS